MFSAVSPFKLLLLLQLLLRQLEKSKGMYSAGSQEGKQGGGMWETQETSSLLPTLHLSIHGF